MPPRSKGRGAREQSRNTRRNEYAEELVPHLVARLEAPPADAHVLIVGDELHELAAALAPKVARVALLATEFERWEAATQALADLPNVRVVQELDELADPDGFPDDPWTYGVLLVPYHLGTREMNATIGAFSDWLKPNAPVFCAGSRHHDWGLALEKLGALIGPLTTLYSSDPIKVVRGSVRGQNMIESGQRTS